MAAQLQITGDFESNPFRPTPPRVDDEISESLTEYLREQAANLRRIHALNQAGDTTFPWDILTQVEDERRYTLGSVGRFFHPDYGIILGRYVQFESIDGSLWSGAPYGLYSFTQGFAWIVTNKLNKSRKDFVAGFGASYVNPANGQFGWIIISGVNIQEIHSAVEPSRWARISWYGDDRVEKVSESAGIPAGIVFGSQFSDEGDYWAIPPGSVYIDTITFKEANQLDIDLPAIEAKIQQLKTEVITATADLQARLYQLQTEGLGHYTEFQRVSGLLQTRIEALAGSQVSAAQEVTDQIQLIVNFRRAAETASENAQNAAGEVFANLTLTNDFTRRAEFSATEAGVHAETSTIMANRAVISGNEAGVSASAAATSASEASVSATDASVSAAAALTSETNAATSASDAATSESAAATSASDAATSASQASTSETNAAGSASSASTSATAAANSATTATTQAGIATTQAGNASTSASAAATSATSAAGSATTATTQATNAANSATTATTQAGIATTQAGNASTSATAAASSATSAAGSATTASTEATNAAASATTATTQAGIAATQASNASTSASAAASSATSASGSASTASTQATNAANSASSAGTSASAASTSASSASTSATNASSSASTATTQASNASTSAGNAASSASAASSSATSASSSASSASASATLAAQLAQPSLNANPVFALWSAGLPVSWGIYNSSAGLTQSSGGQYGSPYYITWTSGGNVSHVDDRGFYCDIAGEPNTYYVVEADVEVTAGTFEGAGFILESQTSGGTPLTDIPFKFHLEKSTKNAVPSGLGRYRFSYLFRLTDATMAKLRVFFLNTFTYSWTSVSSKTLKWYLASVRPATFEEIRSGVITKATVDTVANAMVDGSGNAIASWATTTVAGSASAAIRIQSMVGGSSDSTIALEMQELQLWDSTTRKLFGKISSGGALLTGDLQVGGSILVGSRRIPVALQPFIIECADAEAVSYGVDLTNVPLLSFNTNGLAAKTAAQTYDVKAESPTSSGFTMRAKILTPGTTALVTSTGGTNVGGTPAWQMQKTDAADAYNGNYTFTVTMNLDYQGEPGFYQAWAEFDCYVRPSGGSWILIGTKAQWYYSGSQGVQSKTISASFQYGSAVGQHATNTEFGVHGISGTITAFTPVTYTKQSTSGVSSATPSGEKVIVTVIPQNM